MENATINVIIALAAGFSGGFRLGIGEQQSEKAAPNVL